MEHEPDCDGRHGEEAVCKTRLRPPVPSGVEPEEEHQANDLRRSNLIWDGVRLRPRADGALQAQGLAGDLTQAQVPVVTSSGGFRDFFMIVTWIFVAASAIGFVILAVNAPDCDYLVTSRFDTTEDCDARNYYWFGVGASAVSAFLFAMIMFALSSGLYSLARIEDRISALIAKQVDDGTPTAG